MATSTPWGVAQTSHKIIRGVNDYSTWSHGGVCVSRGLAMKRMSDYARSVAIETKRGFWFEEDCNFSFVMYEIPEALEVFLNKPHITDEMREKYTKDYWLECIKRYNPEYKG